MKNQHLIFLLAFLCLSSATISAQVSVSQKDEVIVQNQTSATLAFTVPAGDDRLLLVSAGTDLTPLSVTFDGTPMTLGSSPGAGSLWTLALGTDVSATSGDIVFTITGATPAMYLGINAISFSGVDQTTPVENITEAPIAASALSSSITIASNPNDLVYDGVFLGCGFCFSAPTATPLAGTTLQNQVAFTGNSGGIPVAGSGATGTTPGAASVSPGWTFGGSSVLTGVHNGLNIRSSPLVPVELSSFTVQQREENVLLKWETQSEVNSLGFAIERSSDGDQFQKMAFFDSEGDIASIQRYQFTDANPPQGLLYYRLKQMDHNGDYKYSKIAVVDFTRKGFRISPNPASEFIQIETYAKGDGEINIYDAAGGLVKSIQLMEDQSTVDISDLHQGVFLVVIRQGQQISLEQLMVVD